MEWSSLDPIPQFMFLKLHCIWKRAMLSLLGISGTEIKWHHWLGIKKNVDEPAAIGEHIPRRRKLLIRCSICGLIFSPWALRWQDLHKTRRSLPGRAKDPARCVCCRHVNTQEVYSPEKAICYQLLYMNQALVHFLIMNLLCARVTMHTCSKSWWGLGFKCEKQKPQQVFLDSILWHFVFIILLFVVFKPKVSMCKYKLFFWVSQI